MAETALTRPARPGDVLWSASGDGWRAEIVLAEPIGHPPSGMAYVPAVRVEATLRLATKDGILRPDLQDDLRSVMGMRLDSVWGRICGDECDAVSVSEHCDGDAIAPMLTEAIDYLREQIRTVEEVRDAHASSVARLESARQSTYAARSVPADDEDADDGEDD